MHSRSIRLRLVCGCFSLLLVHSTIAQINPPPPPPDETPSPSPTPDVGINDDLIPPPPATPPPQETPSPSPFFTPPPMPSIPPTPGPINPIPDLSPPPPPPPPPPLETPIPEPQPTIPPIYPPPVPTAPPIRQGVRVGPSATILLPTAEVAVTASVNSIFQLVALPQEQIVQVTVHYASTDLATASATEAAQIVRIEAIDGGRLAAVTPPLSAPGNDDGIGFGITPDQQFTSATVGANGNLTFLFQAGHLPGLYQIRIDRGNQVLGMQFWIRDPQNPGNDPPAVAPSHMDVPSPNPL